jgi:hypothetical protein
VRRLRGASDNFFIMRIKHSAVTSAIYELVKVFELDIQLGEDSSTMRIELFRNTEKEDHFRCRVWESELFRLTPSFPMDENSNPAHTCDDLLMVDRGIPRSHIPYPREDIIAPNIDAAFEIVLNDLKGFLEHATLEKAT